MSDRTVTSIGGFTSPCLVDGGDVGATVAGRRNEQGFFQLMELVSERVRRERPEVALTLATFHPLQPPTNSAFREDYFHILRRGRRELYLPVRKFGKRQLEPVRHLREANNNWLKRGFSLAEEYGALGISDFRSVTPAKGIHSAAELDRASLCDNTIIGVENGLLAHKSILELKFTKEGETGINASATEKFSHQTNTVFRTRSLFEVPIQYVGIFSDTLIRQENKQYHQFHLLRHELNLRAGYEFLRLLFDEDDVAGFIQEKIDWLL